MRTYARIQDGIVAELVHTEFPISGLFHPGLTWIEVSSLPGVGEGWTFNGATFTKPALAAPPIPMPTMTDVLAELASLKAEIEALKSGASPSAKQS